MSAFLRTIGIGLLRIPNGLVLEDPDGFVRKLWEHIGGNEGSCGGLTNQ